MLSSASTKPPLRGVVFDIDGTLTVPNLDFNEMYSRCGVATTDDILLAVAAKPQAEREGPELFSRGRVADYLISSRNSVYR